MAVLIAIVACIASIAVSRFLNAASQWLKAKRASEWKTIIAALEEGVTVTRTLVHTGAMNVSEEKEWTPKVYAMSATIRSCIFIHKVVKAAGLLDLAHEVEWFFTLGGHKEMISQEDRDKLSRGHYDGTLLLCTARKAALKDIPENTDWLSTF